MKLQTESKSSILNYTFVKECIIAGEIVATDKFLIKAPVAESIKTEERPPKS